MRIARVLLLVGLVTLPAACSSSSSNSGGPDVSNLSPTWTNVYSAVLAKRCLPCHSTSTGVSLGQLDLSTADKAFTNMVGVQAKGSQCAGKGTLVVAGQSSSSLLVQKVGPNPPCGTVMPFGLAPLSSSEQNLIKDWIDSGATQN